MTVTVKSEKDLVVPRSIRREAGIKPGDRLEFRVSGGVMNIVPKEARTVRATDEYTPAQRKKIDAELLQAQKGPFHGPYRSADDMIAHIEAELKRRSVGKKANKRPR
jgi:bifunctional DNA-binding transcriptional regulator/antitoxin component of YhaV-PrlF toxin-antitoxin module